MPSLSLSFYKEIFQEPPTFEFCHMSITFEPIVLELLSSRICHDVVSPVGAINNGVELVSEMGVDAGMEAMDLIAKSAEQANRRLKIFRLCYGAAGSNEKADIREMRTAVFHYFEGSRAVIEWPENDPIMEEELPKGFQKGMLNLILLCGEMITKGGIIKIQKLAGPVPTAQVSVDGEGVGFREGQRAALEGTINEEDLDPRLIHAYVTGKFISAFGLRLDTEKVAETKHRFRISAS